jgi:DnaJ domain
VRHGLRETYALSIATFYEFLGVAPGATETEVRHAYRQLARAFHPDSVGAKVDSDAAMAALNEAWHTLSDPGRRAAYDASLRVTSPKSASATRSPLSRERGVVTDDSYDDLAVHNIGTRRWPAAALMLLVAMAAIFVFSAYALGGSNQNGELAHDPVQPGGCVSIRPGPIALQVSCSRPHYGRVVVRVPNGDRCPIGSEGYYPQGSLDHVCVRPGS